jgi:hypothetical protein
VVPAYPNIVVESLWAEAGDLPSEIVDSVSVGAVTEWAVEQAAGEGVTRCELQAQFVREMEPIFTTEPMPLPTDLGIDDEGICGDDSGDATMFSFRDLMRSVGHMLVGPEAVMFRLPCVPAQGSGLYGGPGCTNVMNQSEAQQCSGVWPSDGNVPDCIAPFPPGDLADFPKLVAYTMEVDPEMRAMASDFGLFVTCNHGNDCSQTGDFDGDGFCDSGPNADYCPRVLTGANCDHDGDGFGEGAYEGGKTCFIIAAAAFGGRKFWNNEEEKEYYEWLLCGGCDNCPSRFNPVEVNVPPGESPNEYTLQLASIPTALARVNN